MRLEIFYRQLREECMDIILSCKRSVKDLDKNYRREMRGLPDELQCGGEEGELATLGYYFQLEDTLIPSTTQEFDLLLGSPKMALALSALLPISVNQPVTPQDWCYLATAYLGVLVKGEAVIDDCRESQSLEQSERDWLFRFEQR